MSYGKLRLKALGLSLLAALALSAIAASGAQAGKWFINNAAFHGTAAVTGSGGGIKFLSLGLNFECLSSTLSGTIGELTKGLVTITFTSCKFLEGAPLTLSTVCSINGAVGEPGEGVITATLKLSAFLHGGEAYVLFEPDVNGSLNERPWADLQIVDAVLGSEECVLSGLKEIKGTQVALILSPATEQLSHEIDFVSEGVQLSLFSTDFLHIGANPAVLDTASCSLRLSGDQNWSFR